MSPVKSSANNAHGGEIELKLSASPEVLAKLKRPAQWTSLLQSVQGRAVSEKLRSVYYDTKSLDLRAKGIALRLRHHDTHSIQTVKTAGKRDEIAPPREEYEARLDNGESAPDPQLVSNKHLRRQLRHVAAKARLSPVFETAVQRTTRALRTRDGDEIELAIDIGEIRGENGHAPIAEMELELKSGTRAALYKLARQLVRTYPLRLRLQSKAARGYALIVGETISAVKAGPLTLDGDKSTEIAFETILRHCLQHFLANEPAVIETQSPQGVHQMRVALRRLRSAFKLFDDFCQGDEAKRLEHEAKVLSRRLGELRDLDVFLSDTIKHARQTIVDHDAALTALAKAAEQARHQAWDKIIATLNTPRFMTFALDLALFIETRQWREALSSDASLIEKPLKLHVRVMLTQTFKKISKLGRELKSLDEDSRHVLRKRLKKLRYATDFFSSLFNEKAARSYSRKLEKLQDEFGLLNDIATAGTLMPFIMRKARASLRGDLRESDLEKALQAVEQFNEDRRNKILTAMLRQWRSFSSAQPYWEH